ncbi:NAD-dependent epimerase/dehydratase family protein [Mucilaginibacter flavidus]|uniref:NAD-dependent epimerase/dehydratase family protein n=1 Tax=Mucilaginibacter flavidus TaxID=2949309 RepID=UPI002093E4F5|nr:NAD(P)-dependent oxidoreductase [Mucilaginibacter flavidus]MCO5948255.1 NAD(P)-dependent oxidoreductase [Mucilaginibacter flavidus]
MGAITNILITGGTGYLGSNLVETFLKKGFKVTVLKRETSNVKRLNHLINRIKLYDIETFDHKHFFETENIDCIVHTAASYGRKGESLSSIYNANLFFSIKLLEWSVEYNVKYFFYANTALPQNLNSYSLSKKQFSEILKLERGSVKVVDIELQYFYGPGDDVSKLVTFVISKIRNGDKSINFSEGIQVRDFVYIADVMSAYLVLFDNAENLPGYSNVQLGSGSGIELRYLIQKIKEAIGNNDLLLNFGALPTRPNEIMYAVANIDFLTKLGWNPKYSIDQGLIETINKEKQSLYDYYK